MNKKNLIQELSTIKKLFGFLMPYKFRLILGLLCGVGFAAVNSSLLLIIRHIGDTAFHGHMDQGAMMRGASIGKGGTIDAFLWMALLIPAVMIARSLFSYANVYFLTWVSMSAIRDMSRRVF